MIEVGLPILLRFASGLVLLWSALHFFGTWITFRIVNFILIIGLGIYCFKTYLAVWIREQIEKRDRELHDLCDQEAQLRDRVHVVVQETQEQEKKIQAVQVRIRQWQSSFEQCKVEAKSISVRATEQMMARKKNQLHALSEKKYNETVVPLILQEAREQLEHDFSNEAFGKAYLTKIIISLQRDNV